MIFHVFFSFRISAIGLGNFRIIAKNDFAGVKFVCFSTPGPAPGFFFVQEGPLTPCSRRGDLGGAAGFLPRKPP